MPSTRSGASYNSQAAPKKLVDMIMAEANQLQKDEVYTTTRSLSGHIQSQPEGLQQCIAAQRVPDPCRSVEELHEFLPDCEKIPGPYQHFQVTQLMAPLMEKKNMILLTAEWRKNNPTPPKQVPKTGPVGGSRKSNMKKQPKAQKKGKGKAPATKTYSHTGFQRFSGMSWKMYFRWPEE
ncbi:hypothetical protein O181_100127 [Austropuccinia psidii MF-1]|uniref:Uncharacterized protein n=1 Tax=Austropuccinia psidii MF-1 TaxID=1389203 RepID=A0A9Q3JDK4_9BASI|nr:hypothetical protein [Austropuccinia psidii MF-1]